LSGDDKLIELAHWLMQSDNLHWLQWVDHAGSEADVSAYFTPQEWMWLGTDRLLWEQQRVYVNFINAIA
jgi:alpha-amylase